MEIPSFTSLFEARLPLEAHLPDVLASLYGKLFFPSNFADGYIYANFVSTLDGVVSFGEPGFSGAEYIGASNPQDRILMGLLRALSDVVVAGASTLRGPPGHVWTPDFIYPPLATAYHDLRQRLGLPPHPLNVIVTASGRVDLSLPVFNTPGLPVLLLTTPNGADRMAARANTLPVIALHTGSGGLLSAGTILEAIRRAAPARHVLVEGGPHMVGRFMAEGHLNELFLTLSPQVAGRDLAVERPGFVAGQRFGPLSPVWGNLLSIKAAGSFLFLRYSFQ